MSLLGTLHGIFVTALAIVGLHRALLTATAWRARARRPAAPSPLRDFPHVTVQIPLYNERYVAARALEAVAALRWPADRLHIQLLDDSTDDTPELLAAAIERIGRPVTHLRRLTRAGFKAGALQHGLERAPRDCELFLVLDADFVPEPDLLENLVPYLSGTGASMVQARWTHRDRETSWLTELEALILDAHFLVEHPARSVTGSFLNFNGSAGLLTRRMIEDAGGWQDDTLTEDLDLSYRAQLAGHRFVFARDVTCAGDLPRHLDALRSQQTRWVKGSVQTARKLMGRLLAAPLPLTVKTEAALHLMTHLVHPLLFMALLTWVPMIVAPTVPASFPGHAFLLAGGLGSMAFFYGTAHALAGGPPLRFAALLPATLAFAGAMALNHTLAVLSGLRSERGEFVRTPKGYAVSRTRQVSWIAAGEIALAAYLGCGAALALQQGLFSVLPFLGIVGSGLLIAGLSAFVRREDGVRSGLEDADIRRGTPQEGSLMVIR